MNPPSDLPFAVYAKPQHANNRLLIDGIAHFAQENPECHFKLLTPEMLAHATLRGRYRGIVCQIRSRKLDALARKTGIPIVDVRNSQPSDAASVVDSDNYEIGRLAAEHLIEHKFENFAYFGYRGMPYSDQRRDGFVDRLAESGRAAFVYEANVSHWKSTRDWALPGFDETRTKDIGQLNRHLAKLPKPAAVFCCHDPRAMAVLEACELLGIRVPDNLAILGVDNDSIYSSFCWPRLSSVDPSTEEIGFCAAREIAELAATDASRRRRRTVLIKPRGVVSRESTEVYPVQPAWLSDALVFIRRNAAKGISAADVFAHLGLSHTIVQAAFRNALGTSVQKEIIAVRIGEAKRLLASGEKPVGEVSAACGFASPHYFCQAFTTATGASPTKFLSSTR